MNLTLSATSYYPKTSLRKNPKTYNKVLLGIGGNKPHTLRAFRNLFRILRAHPKIFYIESSPILHNPAFGFIQQPPFENATLLLHTTYNLIELYTLIFYLERRFGRPKKRVFKNAPRILDIDIIFFNKLILKRGYLTIPHSHWQNRESVCIPMSFMKLE
ncbi:2-amino-4-hydroxy-6-hydroxymethyldihydropteridine diphosphokinase [uncultured Helicobacter sp.]|uniref:2-amino-4-hydroxy-6- hydroxymethyldihydropteridine diphosphokinase n=1 Tax=uncultured Helicobacter sp. TaxID=175537 RepID=UPI00374F0B4B